jgi:hypothetical protein
MLLRLHIRVTTPTTTTTSSSTPTTTSSTSNTRRSHHSSLSLHQQSLKQFILIHQTLKLTTGTG